MEGKIVIPLSISGFTEFIKLAYGTAEQHLTDYSIDSAEFAKVTPLFNEFTHLEGVCSDPLTASKINRAARNAAREKLETQWRAFLNKEIRLNEAISTTDKAVFGIVPRDETPTRAEAPKEMGQVTAVRTGECQYDIIVEEVVTGKKKRPDDATGSNLYSVVAEREAPAPLRSEFHYEGFSSTCHHKVVFAEKDLARRAWVFSRYSNQHGQEGPNGPLLSFIIS
ncbi:MAG: hypothetical protein LBP98_00855 [Tannerella sp.]|nr:hypothetical protein [Tannerella sp.]